MAAATILNGCGISGSASSTPVTTTNPGGNTTNAGVTVSADGTQLLKGGQPWEPHGFVSVALVRAPAYRSGAYLAAYSAFSKAELDQMKTFGADTIRFQISQPGLDPDDTSGNYDPNFLSDVESKVKMALSDGFVVILSLQNENQGGTYTEPPMPNDGTVRVWGQVLASDPNFKNNSDVMFEIFNEPQGQPTSTNWAAWQTAHNQCIAAIRADGAKNVIIADGLAYAETLNGAPDLTDTISPAQLAYASHPFFHMVDEQSQAAWEADFGNFAATHAVVNTAWGAEYYCDADTAAQSLALLQYMHSLHVGLMAYAMDMQNGYDSQNVVNDGKTMQTIDPWALSTFVGVNCGSTTLEWGPGKIISSWYQTGTPPTSLE